MEQKPREKQDEDVCLGADGCGEKTTTKHFYVFELQK